MSGDADATPLVVPAGTALAKLDGKFFLGMDTTNVREVPFAHYMTSESISIGRSDPEAVHGPNPTLPAADGVDFGLGDSNKLSRHHANISMDRDAGHFVISCVGKNGLSVTTPDLTRTIIMVPATGPVPLPSRALIQMGDALFVFLLPSLRPASAIATGHAPSAPLANAGRPGREWIKAEHNALRSWMMRFGYGRWEDVIRTATGRLGDRAVYELVPVARRFVAQCHFHARPGVERKVLQDVLMEEAPGDTEEAKTAAVEALLADVHKHAEPSEARKFIRWARKLRLLKRLSDVHGHESVDRLRQGKLRVFTPPPSAWWTPEDDADLLLGTYKHGYGCVEALRADEAFNFHFRTLPAAGRKIDDMDTALIGAGSSADGKQGDADGGLATAEKGEASGDDDDDDEEDEDGDDEDDDGDGVVASASRAAAEIEAEAVASGRVNGANKAKKVEDSLAREEDKKKSGKGTPVKLGDRHDADVDERDDGGTGLTPSSMPRRHGKFAKKEVDASPDGGGSGGTGTAGGVQVDGNNTKESAMAAHVALSDTQGRVAFPPSEALMRRLKSIINSCAKEFDRDMREEKKRQATAERARRRRDDLAAKKQDKVNEKKRLAEERRKQKSQPFSKKDATDFERALSNFGCDYRQEVGDETRPESRSIDWAWFISKASSFQSKYTETLDSAFQDIMSEAHRITELAAATEEDDPGQFERAKALEPSVMFSTLTLERAERLLERVEFFRFLRVEVLTHERLGVVLRGYKRPRELPLWWRGLHDRALLWGVDRHGLNAWDGIENDPELSFLSSKKSFMRKHAADAKALKRGAFPKPGAATKRAKGLITYFRMRHKDPMVTGFAGHSDDAPLVPADASATASAAASDVPLVATRSVPASGPGSKKRKRGSAAKRVGGLKTPLYLEVKGGTGVHVLELGEMVVNPNFLQDDDCSRRQTYCPVGYRAVSLEDIELERYGSFLFEILFNSYSSSKNITGKVEAPLFRVRMLQGADVESDGLVTWRAAGPPTDVHSLREVAEWIAKTRNQSELLPASEMFGTAHPTLQEHFSRMSKAAQQIPCAPLTMPSAGMQETMFRVLDTFLGEASNNPWTMTPQPFSIDPDWIAEFAVKRRRRSHPVNYTANTKYVNIPHH